MGVENRSEIDKITMQKAIENKMQVGMGFGWLLGRIFVDFGSKSEAKLGPNWNQNPKNEGSKTMSTKMIAKILIFRAILGR